MGGNCYIPEQHCLADSDHIGWEQLKSEHFIVSRDAPGPEIHNFVIRQLADLGHSPSVERIGVGRETLMHLVALGFGISLISETGTATCYPKVVFRPLATSEEDLIPYSAV